MIGENKNFVGGEAYLRQRGVEVVVLDDKDCTVLMDKFIEEKPELWYVLRDGKCPFWSFVPWTAVDMTDRQLLTRITFRNEDIGVEERVWSKEVNPPPSK